MDPSYNNNFGSFGNGVAQQPPSVQQSPSVQQPFNTQQDIILTPSSEKKPKKWLVVVILLLVGFGLTAGVVALVMWKGDIAESGEDLVYKLANLLVTGEESKEKLDKEINVASLSEYGYEDESENEDGNGEKSVKNIYTIPRNFEYGSEEITSYYNSLERVLDKIINKKGSEQWESIIPVARSVKKLLPRYFVATILADTNAGYDYFVEHKNLDGFLLEYGFPFDENEVDFFRMFDTSISQLFYVKKEMYEKISSTDCLMPNGVDYMCLNMLDSEEIRLLQSRNMKSSNTVRDVVDELLKLIVDDVGGMTKTISGGEL